MVRRLYSSLENHLTWLYPRASGGSVARDSLKSHSTLIPEQIPKPLQLFHRITLDSQIKIPSLNGSSAQKQRLDDTEERREKKREQLGADCSQVLYFPVSAFVFPGRRGGRGGQTPFSVMALCLVNTTFPFSVLKLLLQFLGVTANSPIFTNYQYMSKQSL